MYSKFSFTVTGSVAAIQHNGDLADPMNGFAREIKALTSRKTKTDKVYEALARLEFLGSAYTEEEIDYKIDRELTVKLVNNPRLILPGDNVERMILDASKGLRLASTKVKAGLFCEGDFPLFSEKGKPLSLKDIYWDATKSEAVFRRRCVVNKKTVVRTRVLLPAGWSADVEVTVDPDILPIDLLLQILDRSHMVGFFDWRPRYGRFTWKEKKAA